MYGFATATVIGNLTRDPEVRYTPQGKASALFSLAVNRTRVKKESGEKVEETTYIDIRAWEKIAEICREAKKGDAMFVSGEIREERWEKDGQKRSKLRLVAHDIRRIPKAPPRDKPADPPQPAQSAQPAQKPVPQAPKPADTGEDFEPGDDIPF
jgi:single-strand DNA-binding protein